MSMRRRLVAALAFCVAAWVLIPAGLLSGRAALNVAAFGCALAATALATVNYAETRPK